MAFRPRAETLPLPLDWWRFRLHWRTSLICLALAAINLAYFTLAALGLRRARPLSPIVWSMLATIALRGLLLLTLDNSETRYTLEFYPVLIVLAAGFLARARATYKPYP